MRVFFADKPGNFRSIWLVHQSKSHGQIAGKFLKEPYVWLILKWPQVVLDMVQIQMDDVFLVKQEVMTIHESFWAFLSGVVGPLYMAENKWGTGVITLVVGSITPFTTGRGPLCAVFGWHFR